METPRVHRAAQWYGDGLALAARAQQGGPIKRVGFLTLASLKDEEGVLTAFLDGLRSHGLTEGKNLKLDYDATPDFDFRPEKCADALGSVGPALVTERRQASMNRQYHCRARRFERACWMTQDKPSLLKIERRPTCERRLRSRAMSFAHQLLLSMALRASEHRRSE